MYPSITCSPNTLWLPLLSWSPFALKSFSQVGCRGSTMAWLRTQESNHSLCQEGGICTPYSTSPSHSPFSWSRPFSHIHPSHKVNINLRSTCGIVCKNRTLQCPERSVRPPTCLPPPAQVPGQLFGSRGGPTEIQRDEWGEGCRCERRTVTMTHSPCDQRRVLRPREENPKSICAPAT